MPTRTLLGDRKGLQEKLLRKLSDFDYRFIRYKSNYSVAVAYFPEVVDLSPLKTFIRETDRFFPLQDNVHVIIFDGANDEKGLKAANNLLTYFQHAHFGKSLYASVVTANHSNTAPQMVAKLFDLLDYSISHNMDNLIIDDTQVMGVV